MTNMQNRICIIWVLLFVCINPECYVAIFISTNSFVRNNVFGIRYIVTLCCLLFHRIKFCTRFIINVWNSVEWQYCCWILLLLSKNTLSNWCNNQIIYKNSLIITLFTKIMYKIYKFLLQKKFYTKETSLATSSPYLNLCKNKLYLYFLIGYK